VLQVSVAASTPDEAADYANAMAEAYLTFRGQGAAQLAQGRIAEIDQRIAELQGDENLGETAGTIDVDPLAHRETLAPDSDELEAIEEEDEASLDEEDEWLDEEEEAEDEDQAADYRDAVDEDFEDDEDEDEDEDDNKKND
jgi:hypothetical protein